jgi:hypothetical protein
MIVNAIGSKPTRHKRAGKGWRTGKRVAQTGTKHHARKRQAVAIEENAEQPDPDQQAIQPSFVTPAVAAPADRPSILPKVGFETQSHTILSKYLMRRRRKSGRVKVGQSNRLEWVYRWGRRVVG